MSVLCQVASSDGNNYRIVSKGAPEVLKHYLKDVPADYDSTYLPYVKSGARVLAVAWKPMPRMSQTEVNSYTREEAEANLVFCGFVIAECPLKDDTLSVM